MVWRTEDGNRAGGNMITGTMNVPMTLEKANYYNLLEKRDQAMPPIGNTGYINGEARTYYECPICGEYLFERDEFCRTCGQRLDTENMAL